MQAAGLAVTVSVDSGQLAECMVAAADLQQSGVKRSMWSAGHAQQFGNQLTSAAQVEPAQMILGMALIVASQATQSAQCVAEVRDCSVCNTFFFYLHTRICCLCDVVCLGSMLSSSPSCH